MNKTLWLAIVLMLPCVAPFGGAAEAEDPSPEVRALMVRLDDNSSTQRVAAADALGGLGATAAPAAAELTRRLSDPDPWVRAAATQALVDIGPASVSALIDLLESDPVVNRVRALNILRTMGPDAKVAVPAIRRAVDDPVERVSELAAEALAEFQLDDDSPVSNGATGPDGVAQAVAQGPSGPSPGKEVGWHQFGGPNRNSISEETGLMRSWPEEGPELLWTIEGLGRGYSSVAIQGGRLFTMGDQAIGDGERSQYVFAFDLATQERLWSARVGPPHSDGPRATPTVDGELLYAIGTEGDLVCLETATGKERWRRSFPDDFDGKMMSVWKFSESPLVDGDRLVCTPGGENATLVALEKRTGEVIWKCAVPHLGDRGKDGAGYSSMVVAEIDGVRQYVQMLGRGVVGVEAETGRFLWGYNAIANSVANITTPVVRGNHVFATTSYKTGCALLHVHRNGDRFHADEVYFLGPQDFENHHGGVVLVGDHIYGGNGQNRGGPTCLDFLTGKIAWKPEPPARGSAALLYVDDLLVFRYDRGSVFLIAASPTEFRILSQFMPPKGEGPAWAHPALNDGRLYLRHGDLLLCYDIREPK